MTNNEWIRDQWSHQQVRYAVARMRIVAGLVLWILIIFFLSWFVVDIPILVLVSISLGTVFAVIWIDLQNIKKILPCPRCQKVPFLIEQKGLLRFKKTIFLDKRICLHCGAQLIR